MLIYYTNKKMSKITKSQNTNIEIVDAPILKKVSKPKKPRSSGTMRQVREAPEGDVSHVMKRKPEKQEREEKQESVTKSTTATETDKNLDKKIRFCLNFLRVNTKNNLLNAFVREDILEYEKLKKTEFVEPVNFYQLNDEFKLKYNMYMASKNFKFVKNEKNTTIACPNCKSLDVIVQYKQFLAGDEVETEVIQCNYCGGVYTNL